MAVNNPGTLTIAPQQDRASIVLVGGILLLGAEFIVNPTTRTIFQNVFRTRANGIRPSGQGPSLADMGVQGLIVLGLYAVASISEAAGNLAIALLVAMWLVFIIRTMGTAGL